MSSLGLTQDQLSMCQEWLTESGKQAGAGLGTYVIIFIFVLLCCCGLISSSGAGYYFYKPGQSTT